MQDRSVLEIEEMGRDLQDSISEQMSSVLGNVKCMDIGRAGKEMANLSVASDRVTRKITSALGSKNPITKLFVSSKGWVKRVDSLENSINGITTAVDTESERLDSVLNGLVTSVNIMSDNLTRLEEINHELKDLIVYYKENPDKDPNGFKSQAAVSRLKVLATTSSLTSQEITKAVLIIQENKEISSQLKEASSNLVPMFKTMMVNVVAAKANEEAVELRKNLIKVANNIVIQTAKSVSNTADSLIEGRQEALISPETLEEANNIIIGAVKRVVDSSKLEEDANMRLIESLSKTQKQVESLYTVKEIEDATKC